MLVVLIVMVVNAAHVAALPAPTIFFVANVQLHIVLGAAGIAWLLWKWRRSTRVAPLALADTRPVLRLIRPMRGGD